MASSSITSWQIDLETMETVRDFILGSFKITADGDCSHEVKKCLHLGIKGMTKLDGILKVRDITLPTIYKLYTFIWARLLSVDSSLHSFAMQEKPLGFWCEHSTYASQFTSEHQYPRGFSCIPEECKEPSTDKNLAHMNVYRYRFDVSYKHHLSLIVLETEN